MSTLQKRELQLTDLQTSLFAVEQSLGALSHIKGTFQLKDQALDSLIYLVGALSAEAWTINAQIGALTKMINEEKEAAADENDSDNGDQD